MHNLNADILFPPGIQYDLNPVNETAFLDKPTHKVLWRGSPDGIAVLPSTEWKLSHRFRLIALANSTDVTNQQTLRVTERDWLGRDYQRDVLTDLGALNARYTDMKTTGHVDQCGDEDYCDIINKDWHPAPRASLEAMSQHRYVMDVDGNAYSARFRAHLMSNQVPLKATIWSGWYTGRIQPCR